MVFSKTPSWLVELGSGLVAVALAFLSLPLLQLKVHFNLYPFVFPIAFVLSEVYEHFLDRNGYSAQDVVERTRGIALAWLLVALYGSFLAPVVRAFPDLRGDQTKLVSAPSAPSNAASH